MTLPAFCRNLWHVGANPWRTYKDTDVDKYAAARAALLSDAPGEYKHFIPKKGFCSFKHTGPQKRSGRVILMLTKLFLAGETKQKAVRSRHTSSSAKRKARKAKGCSGDPKYQCPALSKQSSRRWLRSLRQRNSNWRDLISNSRFLLTVSRTGVNLTTLLTVCKNLILIPQFF